MCLCTAALEWNPRQQHKDCWFCAKLYDPTENINIVFLLRELEKVIWLYGPATLSIDFFHCASEHYRWYGHSVNYLVIIFIIWHSFSLITHHLQNTHCYRLNLLCHLLCSNICLYRFFRKYQQHLQNSYIRLHLQLQTQTILSLSQLYSIYKRHQCARYSRRLIGWRFPPVKATVLFSSIPRAWTVAFVLHLKKKTLVFHQNL